MKTVLYCELPYSYEILYPLYTEAKERGYDISWYIPEKIQEELEIDSELRIITSQEEIFDFAPDAILVPTNSIPHYHRGVKVQIFHGLAGEKKGHFRIRHYFDLYLTQGPYFTDRFREFAEKYGDLDVKETGWSKLDIHFGDRFRDLKKKQYNWLEDHKKVILYAPTFSPSLTSAPSLLKQIEKLSHNKDYFIFIKFHDKMNKDVAAKYRESFADTNNVKLMESRDINELLHISDLIISDTSSVVYEFVLLNKPAITLNSKSAHIKWLNLQDPNELENAVFSTFENDSFENKRKEIIDAYHPYSDGKSSARMWDAIKDYISNRGVPKRRKISFYRRQKVYSIHGRLKKS